MLRSTSETVRPHYTVSGREPLREANVFRPDCLQAWLPLDAHSTRPGLRERRPTPKQRGIEWKWCPLDAKISRTNNSQTDPPTPFFRKLAHRPSVVISPAIWCDRASRQRPQAASDVTSATRKINHKETVGSLAAVGHRYHEWKGAGS